MAAAADMLEIRTPEGIAFSLPLAGPVNRMLAAGIDLAAIAAAGMIIDRVFAALKAFSFTHAVFIIVSFVLAVGYGIAFEWFWHGQTLGKRLMRIRVMDERALRLEFSQIAVRNLLRFIDAMPLLYLTGGAVCFFTRRNQRLGDLAANTIVVRDVKHAAPDVAQLLSGKYNSLLEHRHLAARLRQRVPPEAASVALDALLRRDELTPQARVELFRHLAAYFRKLVDFPPEATEQLSDEQYVRNVSEILFSRARRA